MSKFRGFAQTISAKLYGAFILLSGAVIAVALISLINAQERSAVDARLAETSTSLRYIDQVNALIYAVVMDSRGVYMSPDSKSAAGYAKGIRQFSQQILDVLGEWRKTVRGDDAEAFKTLESRLLQFVEFRRKLAKLSDEVSTVSAREWGDNDANRSVRKALNGDMEALAKVYASRNAIIKEEIKTSGQRATALYSVALALAIALAGLGIFVVSRQVLHPLTRLRIAMGRLADGDFTTVLPNLDRRDEIGELARAVDGIKVKSADREHAKAAEKARQERAAQEQQREKEQRAALDNEAAQAALMARFDEAVGSVVQAAAQGRFDVRVPLADKSGVLLHLAENLNAMCAMIQSALADISRVVDGIASGDLRQKISAEYTGTFGELKASINNTVDRLNAIVGGINDGVSEVTSAAGEVAGATTDLSQRTEEQASSIESTSSALREITAAVQKNAASAQTTSASAADAQKAASHGSAVVSDAIEAMGRIAVSSEKISNIIGVIDEIARQTNLLALNAAVESARAGEAGRSFGVVAAEVRALAQRSSDAAKQITALITQSNDEVRVGAELTQRAGAALNEILTAIRSVSDVANGVAASSQNQAATIGQIETSLAKIERSTQQNSAIVEQNAAAAKTLEMQAEQMSASVSFFKMHRAASTASTDPTQRDAA